MTFALGDIYLHSLDKPEEAAVHYQQIVDDHVKDEIPEGVDDENLDFLLRDAAYNTVVAYNNSAREEHPDSILVEMEARAGDVATLPPESRTLFVRAERAADGRVPLPAGESGVPPRQELARLEREFVKASIQFVELYPDDHITPTMQYIAAEVYLDRGYYEACIPMYLEILESTPDDDYAGFAGASLMHVFERQNELAKVEAVVR